MPPSTSEVNGVRPTSCAGCGTTHVLRTLNDYHTQTLFTGESKGGNHRGFSGPAIPLFAEPNRLTRSASFRLVIPIPKFKRVVPPPEDADADLFAPITEAEYSDEGVEVLWSGVDVTQSEEEEDALKRLQGKMRPRTNGIGGGVIRESPSRLGKAVGMPLQPDVVSLPWLLLLFGTGVERALGTLGEPEESRQNRFGCGVEWVYRSLGLMLVFDATFRRPVVSEIHLWDSTANDLVPEEFEGFPGGIDPEGMRLPGLTTVELAKRWGEPHNKWANILFYIRPYLESCQTSQDPNSWLSNSRRRHASSSIAFEFRTRMDMTIMKVICKMER